MSAPIIIHVFNGEVVSIESAGDLPKIVIVDHVAENIAVMAPNGAKTPEGFALLELAGPGHAEKPEAEWAEWAESLFDLTT